jgi:predicted glutamine amidotransferase
LAVICFSLIFAASASACRMWGFISDAPPGDILQAQLTSFRSFGGSNPNGWAIGYFYPGTPNPFIFPIVRRGGPQATLDPDYVLAVNEVLRVGPKAGLAHVRFATSGHNGIPNPHPFIEPGWMFCHNGTTSSTVLRNLIGQTYLDQHPLDYTNPNIDSELYFVYLMKRIHELSDPIPVYYNITAAASPDEGPADKLTAEEPVPIRIPIESAIRIAVSDLDSALHQAGYLSSQLTFLLTNGKKLWGCRYANNSPDYYTLWYSAPGTGNNWTVASEPLSSDYHWDIIPMYSVMTFTPGQTPVTTAIPHQ